MKTDTILLSLAVMMATFLGSFGQQFEFEHGIEYNDTCSATHYVDWVSQGSLVLTAGDLVAFQPKVIVNAIKELCVVDLTNCPPKQLPVSANSCYCRSRQGDRFLIQLGSRATGDQSGMTIQAVVPGSGPLKNILGAATVGTIPDMKDDSPRVKAVYSLDDGAPSELQLSQNITVCLEKSVYLDICVINGRPDADLKYHVGNKTNSATGDRCVTHKLISGHGDTVMFEYKEPQGCAQPHVIYIEEACSRPTVSSTPATSTAGTPATTATQTTTSTTSEATTPAPVQIEGVCPATPRTLTTLPSGRLVLTDDVTQNKSWTIFQRRVSGEVDFYRPWADYRAGFGSVNDSFWMGLDRIHEMCNKQAKCELLIHLQHKQKPHSVPSQTDGCYYAHYSEFWLDDVANNFILRLDGFDGTAGDSLIYHHSAAGSAVDQPFSTFDAEHASSGRRCSNEYHGAWWYRSCHASNLNGGWRLGSDKGPRWNTLTYRDPVTFSEMSMRRRA